MIQISSFSELQAALSRGEKAIELGRTITALHSIILPAGVTLTGAKQEDGTLPMVIFINTDGFGATKDNTISDLTISTPAEKKAVYAAFTDEDAGTLTFTNLHVTGQFSVIMRLGTKKANVVMDHVDVVNADARSFLEQPQKYGVNVLQGAITLYNFNSEKDSLMTVRAENLTVGRRDAPVSGSGIFVAGFGDDGGRMEIERLHTGAVYSVGRLAQGVADYITAAVFVLNGAHAKEVMHDGEIVTYGTNDMVLDAWGEVDDWIVNAPVLSYGPSGIGFVNFGKVKNFDASKSPFVTYGTGARGYNQYDGTVDNIHFKSVTTNGDGSIAIQVSKPIGTLTVDESIETHGSKGNSLVKGVNMELPAIALSVKDGGVIRELNVGKDIATHGDEVVSLNVDKGGEITAATIGGTIRAESDQSKEKDIDTEAKVPENLR